MIFCHSKMGSDFSRTQKARAPVFHALIDGRASASACARMVEAFFTSGASGPLHLAGN